MSNPKFENVLNGVAQSVPPIWFMRQAGRYHQHYQKLRETYDFMSLCKVPELAAEVALGPINDFDFDVSILFSDLLFPLEALGMRLKYNPGPSFEKLLTREQLPHLVGHEEAVDFMEFQGEAASLTRERLPADKSLIGFVGGPWTLFAYAVGGGHDGHLIQAKSQIQFFHDFSERLVPLLIENIEIQRQAGCEIVMVFDTAAGELSPGFYQSHIVPQLQKLSAAHPGALAYYSKGTQASHLEKNIFTDENWAGFGVDHRWDLPSVLKNAKTAFWQGNFDQSLLFLDEDSFRRELLDYLKPFKDLDPESRKTWVCGLGHGVLPKTPEDNVRRFIDIVRNEFSN